MMALQPNGFSQNPILRQEGLIPGQMLGGDFSSLEDRRVVRPQVWPDANAGVRKQRRGAIDAFVKTCERWNLSKSDQIILLGYMGNELGAEQILMGRNVASQDVLDRTGYLLGISIGLSALFKNDVRAEVRWLNRENDKLAGARPMQVMLKGKMINIIEVSNVVAFEMAL